MLPVVQPGVTMCAGQVIGNLRKLVLLQVFGNKNLYDQAHAKETVGLFPAGPAQCYL